MTSLLAKAAEVSGRSFAGWRNSAHALALALAALVACDKGRIFTMVCLVPRASRAVIGLAKTPKACVSSTHLISNPFGNCRKSAKGLLYEILEENHKFQ